MIEGLKREHVFGQETSKIEDMHLYMEEMILRFKEFFQKKGYSEVEPVQITSNADPTVRFIGSHISTLKDYFMKNKIPENGIFISQPCIRTRNQPKLFDDTHLPQWGSFFKSMGTLVKPDKAKELCEQSLEYLLTEAKIPPDKLVLRINKADNDLWQLAQNFSNKKIVYDDSSMPENYYRHKLGIDGVWGRNLNYAIKNGDNLYDIGNFIFIENQNGKMAVELALGTSTILKHSFSLDHVNSANPVVGIEKINNPLRQKFADAIITTSILLSEGLLPSARGNKERILRSYLRALIYFKNKFKLENGTVVEMMEKFEHSQKLNNFGSSFLLNYIIQTEREILNKPNTELTPEEEKIFLTLKQN